MTETEDFPRGVIFSLAYMAVASCFFLRIKEFVNMGLTVESLFGERLGSQRLDFVRYHIRRTSGALLVHSFLPLGYLIGLRLILSTWEWGYWATLLTTFSTLLPIMMSSLVFSWSLNDWENHPLSKTLAVYASEGEDWKSIASAMNAEFRRVEKFTLQVHSTLHLVVTVNWIIKLSSHSVYIARLREATLILPRTRNIGSVGGGDQYVEIVVSSGRPNVKDFSFWLNSLDASNFQNALDRPISVVEGMRIHRDRLSRFVEVFKEVVEKNPTYLIEEEPELCIGCMFQPASIKLTKNCSSTDQCNQCYCRPLWCMDCIAKWFGSRQDQSRLDTWLSSTCTCPMCRTVFCILDVSPIKNR